jgi:hypothetical protein
MSLMEKKTAPAAKPGADLAAETIVEPELGQALAHFRASMHAWGESAYGRSRAAAPIAAQQSRGPALAWATGWALA